MGRAVWRVTEKPKIGIFGPGPVLAKPPFGIGRPIPTSQNSQLAGYLGGSDSVAMSGGDIALDAEYACSRTRIDPFCECQLSPVGAHQSHGSKAAAEHVL